MAARGGRGGRFRYLDSRGDRISDEAKLARIEALVIPPAWKDVWISPSSTAKIQATGIDAAGRRQYLYHEDFRAQQERGARLNDYIDEHMGGEFNAKDFRTWGGTLTAAIALAERDPPGTETEAKRAIAAVMRTVGERLENTPAVARRATSARP